MRKKLWNTYHDALLPLEAAGLLRCPIISEDCKHNAHLYYILLENESVRDSLIAWLKARNIIAIFHYIPLHSSPAGKRFSRVHGSMQHTDNLSARLLRLPLWIGLDTQQERVIQAIQEFFKR